MAHKWRDLLIFVPWVVLLGSAYWILHAMPQRGRLALPLMRAAAGGDVAAVKNLLGRGADVNATYNGSVEEAEPPVSDERPDKSTSLIYAAGVSPNPHLDMAVVRSHIEVMKVLLAHGADVNVRGRHGET